MTFQWYTVAILVVVAWYWSASETRDAVFKTNQIIQDAKNGYPAATSGASWSIGAVLPAGASVGLNYGGASAVVSY